MTASDLAGVMAETGLGEISVNKVALGTVAIISGTKPN